MASESENPGKAASNCVPCSSLDSSALLSQDEVQQELKTSLALWKVKHQGNVPTLSRQFTAKNFQCALDCINEMGAIAEREGHHPDFHLTSYRDVEIVLFTHKLQGITANDLQLARMLDEEVNVVYSPKWLREHPEAARESS